MGALLSRLNAFVQSAAGWLAVGGVVMSGALAVLARAADLFGGLNWPQAILLGVLLSLATMLAFAITLALGAYAFRLIKPLAPVVAQPAPQLNAAASDPTTSDNVLHDMLARLGELEGRLNDVVDYAERAAEFAASHAGLIQMEKKRALLRRECEAEEKVWARAVGAAPNASAQNIELFSLWESKVDEIAGVLREEFDLNAPLDANPVYEKNPGTKAPGEEKIHDEWVRYEYRRHYHHRKHIRNLIERVNTALDKRAAQWRMNIDRHPVGMRVVL